MISNLREATVAAQGHFQTICPIILQWEGLFARGKHSRQLPILTGVGLNTQCSEKWQKIQNNQTQPVSTNTLYQVSGAVVQGRWLGLLCSRWIQAPCSHRVEHKLLCTPKHSTVKCDIICWLTLQQDKDPTHSSNSKTELLKKQRIKVWWLKVQTSTWLECLRELCINECQQTSMNWRRLIKSHRKKLLPIIGAKGGSTSYWVTGRTLFFHKLLLQFMFLVKTMCCLSQVVFSSI